MSSAADGLDSGSEPDVFGADCAAATSSADFGLVGSRDMSARKWLQAYVALLGKSVNAPNLIRSLWDPNR
jgi:hypothetical protein